MSIPKELRERGDRLRAYVEETQGKPVTWGLDDCSAWVAQWVADETGGDFDWPRYSTEEEARRIIESYGGLEKVWAPIAREVGLVTRYDEMPVVGDIGIIETTAGFSGGIFTFGGGICVRSYEGVGVLGAAGRTFPVRNPDGTWDRRPVVVKVWALG